MAASKMTGGRAVGVLVVLGLSAALSLSAARVVTHLVQYDPDPLRAAAQAIPTLGAALSADPLSIAWDAQPVKAAAAVAAAVPLLAVLMGLSRGMKLSNEDTGREHGDDRFATAREVRALVDGRRRANNVFYTASAGLPVVARDRHTKAALTGRNLNMVCYGISGLGKTFNVVTPSLLQSVGEALPERRYGLRNVPAHLLDTPAWRLLARFARKAAASFPHALAKGGAEEGATPAVSAKGGRAADPAKRGRRGASGAAKGARRRRDTARAQVGEGYDVVNTDPKGDNVRDCGWMFERAGYDVKVFNTIDFSEGLRYNPFAYVPERYVDIKPPSLIEVSVSGSATRAGKRTDLVAPAGREGGLSPASGTSRWSVDGFGLAAGIDLACESDSLSEVPPTRKSARELDRELSGMDPGDPRFAVLRRQRDLKFIEEETGSFCAPRTPDDGKAFRDGEARVARHAGGGCPVIAGMVKSLSYRRSSGTMEARFSNSGGEPADAEIRFAVDPALVLTSCTLSSSAESPRQSVEQPEDGVLVWKIEGAEPAGEGGLGAEYRISVKCHVASARVADGVALTKVVDTLAANLRGTDAQSAKSSDPFWEEAKRLFLMGAAALLFEKYDAAQRTIPSMMKLLDAALPDSGDLSETSPLRALMDEWEYGRVYRGAAPAKTGGRGSLRGGRWVAAATPPHSRSDSIALHCFRAFMGAAPETVQSIVVTCQSAFVNLVSDDVKDLLSADELALDTLGDPGQKQAVFIVTQDTDSPFDCLTALLVQQTIDLCLEKAYRRYGGRLPRHVRLELDEAANIGKVPALIRAMAVVRSRNVSIALYLQSKAQLALVYGEKEADVILDNCATLLFLGAQTKSTLEEISDRVGTETVYSRTFQRNFGEAGTSRGSGENIQSTERKVRSTTQLSRLSTGKILCFVHGTYPILDDKFQTLRHPYYAYINPASERGWLQPPPAFKERFDFREYAKRKGLRAA